MGDRRGAPREARRGGGGGVAGSAGIFARVRYRLALNLMSPGRRFALICANYHPETCGVGDHSMRLGQELLRRGFESAVFTRAPATRHPEAPELPVIAESGPSPLVIAERLRRRLARFEATDMIIQYTPNMLGAWRFGSPATIWLAAAARLAGVNVILLAHELFLPWRHRPDLALGALTLRGQFAAMMKLSHRVAVTMENRLAEIAWLAALVGMKRTAGVVRVGSNALPIARVRRPGRLRLGVFSTLASTKRFDVVLDCFALVHARHPQAELVLLGDFGAPHDRRVRALHAAVAAHPGRDRIRMPGKMELADVAREVSELDVYLFPMISGANTRSGTLPLALGTGLPVVTTRGYETDSLFFDGDNVLFASSLTGAGFADQVLRLMAEPALSNKVSRGAQNLYRKHLSWHEVVNQLLDLI
jgi:glycosyltransferase involved in cell wall biosynthesis